MRNPERPGAPYRPGSSPAALNDVRWLYKKLLEVEALVRHLQAEQMRLSGRVAEDRRHLSAIASNTNQIIRMLLPKAGFGGSDERRRKSTQSRAMAVICQPSLAGARLETLASRSLPALDSEAFPLSQLVRSLPPPAGYCSAF